MKPHAYGRTKLFPTYKLTAKEFSEILSVELGIPCSKTDVDNARKIKVFTPNQVPRTFQSEAKLGRIKRELFPKLEISQFLTDKAAFNLDVSEL